MQNTRMLKNANHEVKVRKRYFGGAECSESTSEVISYPIQFGKRLQYFILCLMGSCLSSPTDGQIVDSAVSSLENGSDEAALIYNGNMVMSSKISVCSRCYILTPSFHLSAKTSLVPMFLAKVIRLLWFIFVLGMSRGRK